MLTRLIKVIVIALAVVFVPYLLGPSVGMAIVGHVESSIPMRYLLGVMALVFCAMWCLIIYLVIEIIYNYIVDG